ncbi:MAG TPA: condensation domain-containing protein, partial [Bacillota bacterium]|nr:condensation domain-containing protein [Bacillota bacterium]
NSLNASTLIFRINKEFNVEIKLGAIFKNPTIQATAQLIQESECNLYDSIPLVLEAEYYPVSSAQKRLFILDQLDNIGLSYHIPLALTISGVMEVRRFENALKMLIKRHEPLRTSFLYRNGEIFQKVDSESDFQIEYFQALEGGEAELIREFIRPFHLDKPPLLRAALVRLEETKHLLVLDIHHIIADGVSMSILIKDFEALYRGLELPALRIQYKDFAAWQNHRLESGQIKPLEEYWRNLLSGELPSLTLPLDFPRPTRRYFDGNTIEFTLPEDLSRGLERMAGQRNVTLNTLLLSLYSLLLNQYSGQDELIIGSLVAGRPHPDLEPIIGVFMNFLPVRIKIIPGTSFVEFLDQIRELTLDIYEHQDYPFDAMVENAGIPVNPSRNPVFDTMLIFHNEIETSPDQEINGLKFSRYPLDSNTSTLDLKMDLFPAPNSNLGCWIEYNTGLFKADTIRKMFHHFVQIIGMIIEEPELKLSQLNLFHPEEQLELTAKRKLNTTREPGLPVAVAATFTAEPIASYLKWWSVRFQEPIEVNFASYNQVFQELLDPGSLLSSNTGANILLVRFEDWLREDQSPEREKYRKLEQNYADLMEAIRNKPKTIPYFIGVFPVSTHLGLGFSLETYIEAMYDRSATSLAGLDNVYMINFRPAAGLYQIADVFDPATDQAGHLPFSDEYYAAMGTMLAREICSQQKPSYPLPVENHTGKTLLQLPLHEIEQRRIRRAEFAAPENELEQKLINIWQDLLSVTEIGINDNFFDLGGHSLKAATLISRIHKELNVEVPLRAIFDAGTLRELAGTISELNQSIYSAIEPATGNEYYPMSPAQKRLFILNQMEGANTTTYNMPGALIVEGRLDKERFDQIILAAVLVQQEAVDGKQQGV